MFEYLPRRLQVMPPMSINLYRFKPYNLYFSDSGNIPEISEQEWQALLASRLPTNDDPREHCSGFTIMHYAQDSSYLLISRWYGGNMLKHEAFTLAKSSSGWYPKPLLESRIIACVW